MPTKPSVVPCMHKKQCQGRGKWQEASCRQSSPCQGNDSSSCTPPGHWPPELCQAHYATCHQRGTTPGQGLWPVPGNQHLPGYGPWQWRCCCPSHTMPTQPWVSRQLPVAPRDPGRGSVAGTSALCRARPVGARGGRGEPGACWERSQDPSDGFVGSSRTRTSPGRRDTQPPPSSAGWVGESGCPTATAVQTPFPRNPHRERGRSPSSQAALWGEWLSPPWRHWAPPALHGAGSGAHGYSPARVGAVGVWVPQQHLPLDETPSPGTIQPPPIPLAGGTGGEMRASPSCRSRQCVPDPPKTGRSRHARQSQTRRGGVMPEFPWGCSIPCLLTLCSW